MEHTHAIILTTILISAFCIFLAWYLYKLCRRVIDAEHEELRCREDVEMVTAATAKSVKSAGTKSAAAKSTKSAAAKSTKSAGGVSQSAAKSVAKSTAAKSAAKSEGADPDPIVW